MTDTPGPVSGSTRGGNAKTRSGTAACGAGRPSIAFLPVDLSPVVSELFGIEAPV
ncbi:hypothetical protein ABZ743_24090 [Streptomyces sp. NPDC006662]|uniref:hypothetical protein n=1 Tax=Streptomyces sp. NPDC006662 TaxID=3156902 RepID=UPI00340859B3